MDIKPGLVLDILDTKSPALSATSDMPVVETKPDASPPEKAVEKTEAATPAEEAEGQDTGSESATELAEELPGAPEGEAKKPARGVQKKLDELRRNAEDAKREAQSERQEKLRLLALLEAQGRKPEPEAPAEEPEPSKPNRSEFADETQWVEAMSDYADQKAAWTARREVNAQIAKEREAANQRQMEQAREEAMLAYQARIEKAKEKHEDFEQYAFSEVKVSPAMVIAIEHSDDGPEIQYFLGKNPAEAERISKLSAPLQLVELGKIAAKLTAPSQPAEAAKPAPVSAAPRPPKPLKAAETQTQKDPSEMSMEEYAAWRREQIKAAQSTRGARTH